MMERMEQDLLQNVLRLAAKEQTALSGVLQEAKNVFQLKRLAGDGSNRTFSRLTGGNFNCICVEAAKSGGAPNISEARAAWYICNHLHGMGVPVPKPYLFDSSNGLVVYEDLGTTHLYDLVSAGNFTDSVFVGRCRELYRSVVENLLEMQVRGAQGFKADWCWDTRKYDRELMLARESGYFHRELWCGLLGRSETPEVHAEFSLIAEHAGRGENTYFLHRDFQSRNIMIKDGKIRFIDFQGGRFGPLGYDLASLLIDPYVNLPLWLQDEIREYYQGLLTGETGISLDDFENSYGYLSMQRHLQIIGAFCYLSRVCGKDFFRPFVRPSLVSLANLIENINTKNLPVLGSMVDDALESLPGGY